MEICVWPRGDYILENLLPQILPLPDNEVILDLLQELAPGRPDEIIEWVFSLFRPLTLLYFVFFDI